MYYNAIIQKSRAFLRVLGKTPKETSLTAQEEEVLRLALAGKTNQQLGKTLGLSEKKVEQFAGSAGQVGGGFAHGGSYRAIQEELV
jgi:DNA-binding NarL/FixJ family response regulator